MNPCRVPNVAKVADRSPTVAQATAGQLVTAFLRSAATPRLTYSPLNEGEEVRVDRFGVGSEHAVREGGVELQSGVLDELGLEERRTFVRNDLVVVPLNYQRWHVDTL